MREVTVNKFRSNLKSCVDQADSEHEPLWVTRKRGKDFVVIGAEYWEQLQETLYVLQNSTLMKQIKKSNLSHFDGKGYQPTQSQSDDINSI